MCERERERGGGKERCKVCQNGFEDDHFFKARSVTNGSDVSQDDEDDADNVAEDADNVDDDNVDDNDDDDIGDAPSDCQSSLSRGCR